MRTPMITRTITTTEATLLMADTVAAEMHNVTVTLPRTYKGNEAILKAARPLVETDTDKAVSVVSVSTKETLYGMTEADFIKAASILPARADKTTNKPENNA